ncbi:TetR/AcrR family transcriptional regulator [Streptomyces sp. NPDC050625]|uniref:TetR/AcrR family transcriptional regulator n=1 Tax=Streptomyces sp. NPDC050625 TaxID=3154629 RepID=UPI00341FC0B4
MVKQERAMRTREALVKAAAAEFDRAGYEGTSLSRISKSVGMSIGAVTFHFSTKNELADAVQQVGRSVTREAVEGVLAENRSALRVVVDLTLILAQLMEREPSVRAAIRLSRELPEAVPWSEVWLPTVRDLLDEAHETGQLHAAALPADVTTLVEYLTSGAEAYLRSRMGSDMAFESAVAQLKRLWHVAIAGVAVDTGANAPGTPLPAITVERVVLDPSAAVPGAERQ